MLSRRSLLRQALPAVISSTCAAQRDEIPLRFAVLSDVQYAERDSAGARNYRESIKKLEAAVTRLQGENIEFLIHLGDLIDGGSENAARILPVLRTLTFPHYHVLGNHDFFGPRAAVLQAFGMKRPYYSFRNGRWRLIVLDGMQVSVNGGWASGSPEHRQAEMVLESLERQGAPNAQDWNGAVGPEQRNWLSDTLEDANRRGERAMVFCHLPTLAEATTPPHLLWDHKRVLDIIDRQPAVAAYMCGHDHAGGYARRNGVHHITMRGVVEHELAECLRIVELYPDSLHMREPGTSRTQVLALTPRHR